MTHLEHYFESQAVRPTEKKIQRPGMHVETCI